MKTVLDLNNIEAKEFFLKEESYCKFELPGYFSFEALLKKLAKELNGKKLKDSLHKSKPGETEGVNYTLLNNKDGKFAWRPFQLIHPAIYVFLVQEITTAENWQIINERFKEFKFNDKIECHSLPIAEDNNKPDDHNQILEWWEKVEQRSLALALEFNHLLHLDITDCYGSIYTHSISWAMHSKAEAKNQKNENNLIGNVIDKHIQYMSYGQTNGIPQGSAIMDFIAEIVLGYGDLLLSEKLKTLKIDDYRIIRYRDDYRIFTNSQLQSSEIAKVLSEVLSELNFKFNSAKTHSSEDIILGSLKQDKIYWIYNKRKTDNIQQWLIQLYVLGKEFPNSGSLFKETKNFSEWLQKKAKMEEDNRIMNLIVLDYEQPDEIKTEVEFRILSPNILISILVNLAYNNPRLFTLITSAVSFLISKIKEESLQKELLKKIRAKFNQLPNTNYLNTWLQRMTLKIDPEFPYSGKLCEKVLDKKVEIWNSDWLQPKIKKIVDDTEIIKKDTIDKMEIVFSEKENKQISGY